MTAILIDLRQRCRAAYSPLSARQAVAVTINMVRSKAHESDVHDGCGENHAELRGAEEAPAPSTHLDLLRVSWISSFDDRGAPGRGAVSFLSSGPNDVMAEAPGPIFFRTRGVDLPTLEHPNLADRTVTSNVAGDLRERIGTMMKDCTDRKGPKAPGDRQA